MGELTLVYEGIDLLVHEARAPNLVNRMNATAEKLGTKIMAKITYDTQDYHATPTYESRTVKRSLGNT
jgi:ribonuclease Z